jgi:hypothetical protein
MSRQQLAQQVEQVGQNINQLRSTLLSNNAPYVAGMVRAAEEALVQVMQALTDPNIGDDEL